MKQTKEKPSQGGARKNAGRHALPRVKLLVSVHKNTETIIRKKAKKEKGLGYPIDRAFGVDPDTGTVNQ